MIPYADFSSFASPLPDAEPTCIHTVMKLPSVDIDCTFYANTKTLTEYTDCGGCALETKYYGVGLVSFPLFFLPRPLILIHPLDFSELIPNSTIIGLPDLHHHRGYYPSYGYFLLQSWVQARVHPAISCPYNPSYNHHSNFHPHLHPFYCASSGQCS